MATKKAAPKKSVSSKKMKTAPKKTSAKKTSSQKKVEVGAGYECSVCGLAVSVDRVCGCVDTCDLMCCDEPMQKT